MTNTNLFHYFFSHNHSSTCIEINLLSIKGGCNQNYTKVFPGILSLLIVFGFSCTTHRDFDR